MINWEEQSSSVLKGAVLIVAAMALIGLIDNFVKYIATYSGVWQFHFFRTLIAVPAIVLFCVISKRSIWPSRPMLVVIRSLSMATSIILYFGSLSLLPISMAGAGLFSSPLFLVVFSALLFANPVGTWRISAVALGFFGVVMVLQPDPSEIGVMTFLPVVSGALYALAQLITRHYLANENTSAVLLGFFLALGLLGVLGMVVLAFIDIPDAWLEFAPFFFSGWRPLTVEFFFWTTIQALGSLIAVAGLIRGYQIADPTFVGVFEYSFLIFAGFWGWVIWDEFPNPAGMVGIAAIILAGTLITVRTRMNMMAQRK